MLFQKNNLYIASLFLIFVCCCTNSALYFDKVKSYFIKLNCPCWQVITYCSRSSSWVHFFKISTVFCVEELSIFPIIVATEDQSKYKYSYMLICRLTNGIVQNVTCRLAVRLLPDLCVFICKCERKMRGKRFLCPCGSAALLENGKQRVTVYHAVVFTYTLVYHVVVYICHFLSTFFNHSSVYLNKCSCKLCHVFVFNVFHIITLHYFSVKTQV